jgi:TonB-dependent receptor
VGNTPSIGTIYGIDIRQRSTLRAFEQSIFTNTLEGKHELGGGWSLNWVGNYTESKDDRSVVGEASWESPAARNLRPTVAYDFSDPNRSRLVLYTTTQLTNPTRFQAGTRVVAIDTFQKPLLSLNILDAVDVTTAYTAKMVAARDMKVLGSDATIKAGFQFDQRTKVVDEKSILLNTAAQFARIAMPTDYNLFSLDKPFLGKIPLDYNFRYFDPVAMRAYTNAARSAFTFAPNTANNYDVREQVTAGFVMSTLRYNWGSLVGGVRVEDLQNRGIALATFGSSAGQVTSNADNTLVFPSVHVNYEVDDTKKVRVSFNTGAARADYDQIRPNVVINDSNAVISGGNPAVKPERAEGVDAYFEWYTQPQGILMAGAFYKQVDDVLYRSSRTFGSDTLNSNGIDRSSYLFTGISNGGEGRLYGVEVAAQQQLGDRAEALGLPTWMGGFGVTANAVFNDSEVTKPRIGAIPARKVRLPGTSDQVLNVGGYYEKYGLSVRLQFQKRSLWLDTIADDLVDGGDTYWDADDELDASIRYAVNDNLEIYAEGSNLLNNPGRRFSEPGNLLTATGFPTAFTKAQTIEWESFGSRYSAGIRVTF